MCKEPLDGPELPAAALNRDCHCITLDPDELRQALRRDLGAQGLASLLDDRPHLFAANPVFVGRRQTERMAAVIAAVEAVAQLPAYRSQALARAPAIARYRPKALGVFMGYDFHLGADGPQLIEINTNAGGALLSLLLGRAQRACCPPARQLVRSPTDLPALDAAFVEMFRQEWRLSRGGEPLRRIAIVDQAAQEQYLYPEFLLFQQLFQRRGIEASIAEPAELSFRDGRLWHRQQPVDLVYNRLTDFYLESPQARALRAAYLADAAVITPHPYAHALFADKRNLATLSDAAALTQLGLSDSEREPLLAGIPRTEAIEPAAAERLWAERKRLFFKPAGGYGSKAAYRGDKLTRRVWGEILQGDYVAQRLIPPSERHIRLDGLAVALKLDIRNYSYAGAVQLLGARLYQGQTTNFRTRGGGLAPVFIEPQLPTRSCC